MRGVKCILVLFLVLFFSCEAGAVDKKRFSTSPVANHGQKWRVAYFEGGSYTDYQKIFSETIRGLMRLGWIKTAELPALKDDDTSKLWEWLSDSSRSDYIEFVKDAYYSTNWDDSIRKKTAEKVLRRLNEKSDIDLLIVAGTSAGKEFANNQHHTPTIIISTSDPIGAGIVKSVNDSGYDHVHAQVNPNRYYKQVHLFHEIVGFKKLGVAFEDTVNGRSYAAISQIQKAAKNRGFEVVECNTKSDIPDIKEAEESVVHCFEELSKSVDAIYVTQQGGVHPKSIFKLVKIANQHGIATFSQAGSDEVKYGFLISISQAGYKYIGDFHASAIAKVFNGARPSQIGQLFEDPPRIAINMKTANAIKFTLPVVLRGVADEIFEEIEVP